MKLNLITKAIGIVGLTELARHCGVTRQAVRKWEKHGLPRTDWTQETNYSETIETATNGAVEKSQLLQSRKN